jgi:glucose/mannose transport system substrate-binding protein
VEVAPTAAPQPTAAPPSGGELEIFSWWTAGGEADGLNAMYGVFEEKYPEVEIVNATVAGGAGSNAKAVLATRMQAGDPPDSFQVHAGHELIDSWVTAGKMEPVTFIFEENGWLDSYPPGVIDVLSYEGEIWSVPVNIHRSNVLWYNKQVFADNGLEAPATFDDFFAVADTLQAAGVTPLALGDNGIWAATHLFETVLLGTMGHEMYNGLWTGETDWNGPGVQEALETFARMMEYVNEDHAALSWDQAAQLVADGDAAMTIMGDWAEGYFKSIGQTPDQEFGWAPSPGTNGIFIMLSDSFGLPQGAPHRDNAVAWLELCGSKEGQDAFNPLKGSIPARTDGDRSLYDAYLQSAMDDFASNDISPSLAHGAAASEGWVTAVNDVMTFFVADLDVASAQQSMAQACADANVCGAPPEATEPPAVVEESSIVIAIPEDPAGFNGHVSDTGYEQMLGELVMLGLTDLDPEGNLLLELAAELPTVENGGVVLDEENWTMDVTWQLRDDIYWEDGEQVTADDVVFTWDAIVDPESGIWVDAIAYTENLEKVDDLSFTVHYSATYPNYALHFGGENFFVWPEHYCDASQGYVAWDCNRQPLSNGPYLLEEWQTGDYISFVRNPDYFEEGKPHIDNILVRIVPERAVIKTMLIEGDADVYMWLTPTEIEELQALDHVGVTFSPTTRWAMRLIPNLAARGSLDPEAEPHPILSDVRVRRAIRMAIDTDLLAEEIFLGYNEPVWTEFFRPPYVCEIPKPEYNPEAAKGLLEEAGWTDQDGDGIRECHGCENAEEGYVMAMENMIYAEYGEELELAQQLIAEMLKDIGIDLELSIVEGPVLWADYESGGIEQNGDFDLNMWDDGYPGIDPTDHLWVYYYSSAAEPDWGWNVGRWYNEEFDALLDEAYTLDEEYRKELFCQMAEILEEELPQIILWTEVDANGYSMRVEGVQATVNDIMTWNVADWEVVE